MKITQNPDGSYREDKYTLVDFIYHAFIVVVGIVLALCIADLIFGAEEMAEVQGEVIYQLVK